MSETALDSPYLTTKELAAFIRKSPEAVRMMRHRGTAPKGTRIGREVLYHLDDVRMWLRAKAAGDHIAARTDCGRNAA